MARIKIEDISSGKKLDRETMRRITGGVIALPEDAGGFKAGVVCLPEEGGGTTGGYVCPSNPGLVGDDPVFLRKVVR